ncbi:Helix-turn-helix domain protein [Nonomuraea coxensis DSM 45129]|uniref:Helix-turn-helix domain protein n=1 Tax=Nonomuraea coxensis DSM 45129 TaxID=1122611 RepID=A0ABX8TVI2_9ACTN|nr:metalloregulator ArsR/SmtB family transcription factor [Nonomuraea coxensis]QYC39407.1 Helix-turn-helix domain protein [Nonomuraea coxensis DSM 45129]
MTADFDGLSDPKAMRALAHPARLQILNRLGVEESATATEVAEIAGITPSAASYHLRMLAKYGFVEDAPPRGDGRERLWRAVGKPLSVGLLPEDQPEVRDAKVALMAAFRREANREADRALAEVERESEEWRDATVFNRTRVKATAHELIRLHEAIQELVEPYAIRNREKTGVPDGARVAEVQVNLFPVVTRPVPGLPTEDHGLAQHGAGAAEAEQVTGGERSPSRE